MFEINFESNFDFNTNYDASHVFGFGPKLAYHSDLKLDFV